MPTTLKAGRKDRKPGAGRRPPRQGAPLVHRSDTPPVPPTGGEPDIERSLDEALKGTFPASDPVALPLRGD